MAKVAVTVIVAVFLTLIASSFARFPLNLPSNLQLDSSSLEIDRSVSSEHDEVQSNPQIASLKSSDDLTESNIDEANSDLPDLDSQHEVLSIPVTVITFRPVNRHFVPFPFHHSRHHHQRFHRAMKPWLSYGNDMILSGENRGFETRPIHEREGEHRMAEEWIGLDQYPPHRRHHHHHHHHEDGRPRFPYMHHDGMMMNGGMGFEDRAEEGSAPMKGFRKFLNQFGF